MSAIITFSVFCKKCGENVLSLERDYLLGWEEQLECPSQSYFIVESGPLGECPKCGTEMQPAVGDVSDEEEEIPFRREWNIEFWWHMRERVFVQLANDLPISFTASGGKTWPILRVLHYDLDRSGLPADCPAFPEHAFGRYYLDTDSGQAVIECKPALNPDGSVDQGRQEWYLVGWGLRDDAPEGRPSAAPRAAAPLPGENRRAYSLLYVLEVRLRWFVHEVMRLKYGLRWWEEDSFWKSVANRGGVAELREVLRKAGERMAEEQAQPYVQMARSDLFAYLDFRNLREMVETFWSEFGQHIPRKRVFLGMLETLEIIRNAVAHNRPVTTEALATVRSAWQSITKVVQSLEAA